MESPRRTVPPRLAASPTLPGTVARRLGGLLEGDFRLRQGEYQLDRDQVAMEPLRPPRVHPGSTRVLHHGWDALHRRRATVHVGAVFHFQDLRADLRPGLWAELLNGDQLQFLFIWIFTSHANHAHAARVVLELEGARLFLVVLFDHQNVFKPAKRNTGLLAHLVHPRRFMELRREVGAISQRMLTLTLRQLERDGLVQRTVYPVVPPRVEYRLTPLGGTLLESIQAIVTWTLAHREEIALARAAYDARAGVGVAG